MDGHATRCPWIVVTGLDGAGKSAVVARLAARRPAHTFRLPYHDFVRDGLRRAGHGTPFGDVQTDRLLCAADARLTNYHVRRWRAAHPRLISERGWADVFIWAAVQGVGYAATDALLGTADLERPTALVYLVADPVVAYTRARQDPDADRAASPGFLVRQHEQTLRFHRAVAAGSPALGAFAGIPACLIDTTSQTPDDSAAAAAFLDGVPGCT